MYLYIYLNYLVYTIFICYVPNVPYLLLRIFVCLKDESGFTHLFCNLANFTHTQHTSELSKIRSSLGESACVCVSVGGIWGAQGFV